MHTLVEHAPTSVHWFVVDAGAITNIDYSAAQSLSDLLDDLVRQKVNMIFARVRPSLHSDMDRHRVTAAISETRIFATAPRSPRCSARERSRDACRPMRGPAAAGMVGVE